MTEQEENNDFAVEQLETKIVNLDGTDIVSEAEVVEEKTTEEVANEPEKEVVIEQPALEYTDDKVLEYLKGKGLEVEDFESLKKPKEVNPYEDLLDDEDRAYLGFKKETGKKISRKEYNEIVTKDFNKVSPYELAKERIEKESGVSLSDAEALEVLEEELGFDPKSDELTPRERIKLASYVKGIRDEKIAEQKAILEAIPSIKSENKQYTGDDYITLENGTIAKKADYDAAIARRNDFLKLNKDAVSRAAEFNLTMTVDDNGKERQLNYTETLEPKDLQRLESISNDVFSYFENTFKKDGNYDAVSLNKNIAWADEQLRGKLLDRFAHRVRAEAIEELMKESGNVNLEPRKPLDQQKDRGIKVVPINELF